MLVLDNHTSNKFVLNCSTASSQDELNADDTVSNERCLFLINNIEHV